MSWDRDHQGRSRLEGQAWNLSLRCSGNFTWDSQVGNFTHESGIQKKICVNKQVAQAARSGLQKVIVRKRRLRRSGQWCRVKVRRLWCPAIRVKKVSWKKKLSKVSKVKTGISPLGLSTWSSWPPESIGLSLVILPQRGLAAPLVPSSPPSTLYCFGWRTTEENAVFTVSHQGYMLPTWCTVEDADLHHLAEGSLPQAHPLWSYFFLFSILFMKRFGGHRNLPTKKCFNWVWSFKMREKKAPYHDHCEVCAQQATLLLERDPGHRKGLSWAPFLASALRLLF